MKYNFFYIKALLSRQAHKIILTIEKNIVPEGCVLWIYPKLLRIGWI